MAKTRKPEEQGADPEMAVRDGGAPAIHRALAVVELLAECSDGLTLSDIARHLDVNKALVHRVLTALDDAGYVFRSDPAGVYRLTYKIRNIGLRQMSSTNVLDQCMPVLRGLADMTDELVRLAIVEGDSITWIAAVQGQRLMLQLNPNYTFRINLHTHATGKAWLSTLPRERARELLRRAGITARTAHSHTQLNEIESELDRACEQGYAITYEEDELGVGALAAPILLSHGGEPHCVGVVSLAAPTSRMTRKQLEDHHALVVAAAKRLAERWPVDALGSDLLASRAPGPRPSP